MFSSDPDNPITWWTYVVAMLIAICIYLIFSQRRDLPSIIGFKNKPSSKTKSNERIPILTTNNLNLIYSKSNVQRTSTRIDNLILQFTQNFGGQQPEFIIRAPGRVNLIGGHIEHCGYNALSMAIEKDILFAVKVNANKNNIIQLCNKERNKFSAIQIDLSSKQQTKIKLDVANPHWSIYFLAAYHGICAQYCSKIDLSQFKSLQIMVDGNIPKSCGLSSSYTLVCGCAVTLLFANLLAKDFLSLSTSEIAALCRLSVDSVSVSVSGMDETIVMTAHKGYAKYITLPDLCGLDVPLPAHLNVRWVVNNCLSPLQYSIQGTRNYNTRTVECRLAAVLLAKLLKLKQWRQVLTFRDVQQITNMELDELLFRSMDLMNDWSYSIQQIEDDLECQELGINLEDLLVGLEKGKIVLAELREMEKYRLPLQKRALHVYGEAHRMKECRDLCLDNYEDDERDNYKEIIVRRLGKLMSDSHLSCRDKYECSCDELDELQSLCIEGGAFGSRLTGAGFGGCVVSLVEADKVKQFKSYVNKNYYASIPKVPLNHQFTTAPSVGLTVHKIVNHE